MHRGAVDGEPGAGGDGVVDLVEPGLRQQQQRDLDAGVAQPHQPRRPGPRPASRRRPRPRRARRRRHRGRSRWPSPPRTTGPGRRWRAACGRCAGWRRGRPRPTPAPPADARVPRGGPPPASWAPPPGPQAAPRPRRTRPAPAPDPPAPPGRGATRPAAAASNGVHPLGQQGPDDAREHVPGAGGRQPGIAGGVQPHPPVGVGHGGGRALEQHDRPDGLGEAAGGGDAVGPGRVARQAGELAVVGREHGRGAGVAAGEDVRRLGAEGRQPVAVDHQRAPGRSPTRWWMAATAGAPRPRPGPSTSAPDPAELRR